MACIFSNWMILILVAVAGGAPISQVGETQGPDSHKRCLQNQELSDDLTCRNCTYCYPGTEHTPTTDESCVTTCRPCKKGQYQPREGYSGLECYTCVSCLHAVELKMCTPSQNAECGDCFHGYFKLQPNTCWDCKEYPTHSGCQEPAQGNHTATPPQPRAPAEQPVSSSSVSTLPLEKDAPSVPTSVSSSPQSPNVTKDFGDSGKPTTRLSWQGILIIVTVILICIILLLWYACKKRNERGTYSTPAQPTKTPHFSKVAFIAVPTGIPNSGGESEQQRYRLWDANRSGSGVPSNVILAPQPAPSTSDTASAPLDNEPLQGARPPVDAPFDSQSSDVTNTDTSLPKPLHSNGGTSGDGALYQRDHEWRAEADSGDYDHDDDDDNDRLSQPRPLMS